MDSYFAGFRHRFMQLFFLIVCGFAFVTFVPGSAAADAVGPQYTNIFPANGGAIPSAKVTISLQAADPDTVNINSVVMKVDNKTVKPILQYGWIDEYTDDYTKLDIYYPANFSEGLHNVSVTVKDRLNNADTVSWSFTVGEPPKITMLQPADGGTVNSLQPIISAKVTDNAGIDPATIIMTVNGSPVSAVYDPFASTVSYIPAAPLDNEAHCDVSLQVRDIAGSLATGAWRFYVNTFPEMSLPLDDLNCQQCHPREQHPMNNCSKCHGINLVAGAPKYPLDDCYNCHFGQANPPTYHTNGLPYSMEAQHHPQSTDSCLGCHNKSWATAIPSLHKTFDTAQRHMTTATGCTQCHAKALTREHQRRIDEQGNPLTCLTCHNSTDPNVQNAIKNKDSSCKACHTGVGNTGHHDGITNCRTCHAPETGRTAQSHRTHFDTTGKGPGLTECTACHDTSGPVNYGNCTLCHSPNGAFDGINDPVIGARTNWQTGVYEADGVILKPGKEKWCAGCHDDLPAVVNSQVAPNKTGDNTTYGYYITGHGRDSDYTRMSWQDNAAAGNPGANQSCAGCHDLSRKHINPGTQNTRLKSGYENDQSNSNCNSCHASGKSAVAAPQFYTNSADYENSAHKDKLCSDCHDVHGSAGAYTAMTRGSKQNLCSQCHTSHQGHALGVPFGKDGKTYSLECVSCHNVHIITGMYSAAESNKSPLSKFTNNTAVWGAAAGQKMSDYASAGGGTYRTPKGDSLTGEQLPDYVSYCLDCHATPQSEFGQHGGISWGGNEPHGLNSANVPNGYGVFPDIWSAAKADGWDGDDVVGPEAWPAIPRGRGDQLWSRGPFNHEERIAGANFILSCSDCHVTHESGIGAKLRSTVNNSPGSTIWNTECNACHWYYSDWHAGMSCGNASCHQNKRIPGSNSIHGIDKNTGANGTRTFDPNLVAEMKFDNNLNDAGDFQMHGRWFDGTGSYAAGRFGNAIVFNGNNPVELGTRDSYWSTDEGKHGTWKYTEMKDHMTLEAWVNPSSDANDENIIFAKHTYNDGGYAFMLKKVNGTLRAGLLVNVNGGGQYGVWDADGNGLRGAYSTVSIPLNKWTHVAATFDTNLPDRDPNDPSVGRVRIYVNGEDVTTSKAFVPGETWSQPGPGETSIFPYSQHSIPGDNDPASPLYRTNPWGYDGHWCASAFSVGGVMWGSGSRKGLTGMLDEAKVWNITKDSGYFVATDALSPPRISKVEGLNGSNELRVTFSEGVYANTGLSGALQPADFVLTDNDNGRTILSVNHVPGASTATLVLSSPLDDADDVLVDTLAAAGSSAYDDYDNPAETNPVTVTVFSASATEASFQFNEPAGSAYILDAQKQVFGKVNDPAQSLTGDGYFHGDGVNNYIDFEYSAPSFKYSTAATLEVRIKPTGLAGVTGNYIGRVLAKNGAAGENYQMSVWRKNDPANFPNYTAPGGVASIAFWVKPVDAHGGNTWKPVMTDYAAYPIVSDHWYRVKVLWNSGKTGGIPGDIFVDDQGTDGNDTGENWSGFVNATDADQSQLTAAYKLYEGDVIQASDGDFTVGCNANNHANNVFNGLIDWIILKR